MAHKNLEEAIHAVQAELRSLSDYSRLTKADEYTQELFGVVDQLANIVEALIRDVDYPMKDGQSLRAE
ncbi:hypothetical protein AB0O87_06155 [Microbacterium sp. NPDC076768]|uniref:hypothetical protein n=1 Tax=Microbacterium sp. NPDC076768 TaxID=3154858 RepID=UPI0034125CBE